MAGLVPAISLRQARCCQPKRDHRDEPGDDGGASPAAIIANKSCGVTGISLIRTPNGASAFSTAEMIAPPAGTHPDSPTPFTPSGLSGEGNSRIWTSIFGTSIAPGSR